MREREREETLAEEGANRVVVRRYQQIAAARAAICKGKACKGRKIN